MLSISSSAGEFKDFSRLAVKVDSNLVYDRIGIYQHSFIFTKNRKWGIVQQAMEPESKMAIRFQWLSSNVDVSDPTTEPHANIMSEMHRSTLDLIYGRTYGPNPPALIL